MTARSNDGLDFFEGDEPPEKIRAAYARGAKGVTAERGGVPLGAVRVTGASGPEGRVASSDEPTSS